LEVTPESETRYRVMVELLLEWAFLYYYQARLYELRKLLVEHQDSVDRMGDTEQKGMWMAWIGHAYMAADGEFLKSTEILDQALEIGRTANNIRVIGYVQSWRVYSLWWLGRIDDALEAGREALELSARLPKERYVWFKAQLGLGLVRAWKGDFKETQRIGDELIEFGRRTGSSRAESMGHTVLSYLNVGLDRAVSLIEARTAVEIASDPIYQHAAMPVVVFALLLGGEIEEARRYHDDQYQRFIVDLHVRLLSRWLEMSDAMITMLEGQPLEGFDQLQQVVEKTEGSGEFLVSCYARTLIAISYTEAAMSDVSLGQALRNARFVFRYGLKAKKEAYARLDEVLEHLDDSGLGGSRMVVESTYARLLAHDGDKEGAARHLQAGIDAIESAGDTAMLREAREFMAELTAG
jgi:tetratricopeptide (TPR) repeat protein